MSKGGRGGRGDDEGGGMHQAFGVTELVYISLSGLKVESDSTEFLEYNRSSNLSVTGGLGLNIVKDFSLRADTSKFIELKSDLGKLNKNEVNLDSLCNALKVY